MNYNREELKTELQTHSLHGGCKCGSKVQCEDRIEWLIAKIGELGKSLSPEARKAKLDEHVRCATIVDEYRDQAIKLQKSCKHNINEEGVCYYDAQITACADILERVLVEYKND